MYGNTETSYPGRIFRWMATGPRTLPRGSPGNRQTHRRSFAARKRRKCPDKRRSHSKSEAGSPDRMARMRRLPKPMRVRPANYLQLSVAVRTPRHREHLAIQKLAAEPSRPLDSEILLLSDLWDGIRRHGSPLCSLPPAFPAPNDSIVTAVSQQTRFAPTLSPGATQVCGNSLTLR